MKGVFGPPFLYLNIHIVIILEGIFMLIYYIYAYLRKSDNTPYYIGKGKNKRAWSKDHNVSVPRDRSKIVIMESNLTELGALALERFYIKWYGRKNNGTGILLNMTDGGDTTFGYITSEETKKKLSEKLSGIKKPEGHGEKVSAFRKTFKYSEESKKKMSEAKKGKKMSEEQKIKISKSLSGKENTESQKKKVAEKLSKKWMVTNPEGEIIEVINLKKFCLENSLDQGNLSRGKYKGWKAQKITP